MTRHHDQNSVPAVSIGMPVYNGENYIREALDSLLAQTFTNFELIISDNASNDATETICREYAARDSRIRYFRQSNSIGGLGNFLFVLDEAAGEYFIWASHDDVAKTNEFLFDLVSLITKTRADLAFPNVDIISTIDNRSTIIQKDVMNPFLNCKSKLDHCLTCIGLCNHQVYGLYRKSSLKDYIKYMKIAAGIKVYGEGLFVQAVTANLSTAFAKDTTKNYRLHTRNISRNLTPPEYLRDLMKYSALCIHFWLFKSPLSPVEKAKVLFVIFGTNGRHAIYLMLSTIKFYGQTFLRRMAW